MKILLTIVLIVGFAGVAIFGVFSMRANTHDVNNHAGGCIAATVQGAGCPNQSNLGDYLAFHLDAFRNLSSATFSSSMGALLILFLIAVGAAINTAPGSVSPPPSAHHPATPSKSPYPLSPHKITPWP